ncbi:MAG: hypothetical protein AAFV53_40525 [Myxococcota bacterium]
MEQLIAWVQSALSGLRGTPLEDPTLLVGIVGGVLLVAGARLYRLALVTPGLAAGMLLGLELTAGASPEIQLVAGLCLGLCGAGVMLLAERVAVSLGGALLVGGLVNAAAPLLLPGQDAWYIPAAGAVVGLFLFPKLFRALLFVFTSLGGALCVSWAMGRPQDLPLIGGLWLVGTVVQWLTRPRNKD